MSDDTQQAATKPCAYCAETILAAAIVCKHCGRDQAPAAAPSTPVGQQNQSAQKTYNEENSTGLWAMIWGIVGIFLPFLVVPPIAALSMGVRGNSKVKRGLADNKGQAVSGIVLGAIGCALLAMLAILAVPFVTMGGTLLVNNSTGDSVAVPDVSGLTIKQAESVLERQGLTLGSQTPEVSQRPVDTIIGQQPAPGEQLEEGGAVNVTVSAGRENLGIVPPLVGLTSLEDAQTALADANLVLGQVTEEDAAQPAGFVLRQDPLEGSSVNVGTTIDIVVSTGRQAVPSVVGQTEDVARGALAAAGFQANVAYQESQTVPQGVVLEQKPPAGTTAENGAVVKLTVAIEP